MAELLTSGRKAAATNRRRYGQDYYNKLGTLGGSSSRTGGFGQGELGRQRAKVYGRLGGSLSSRGKFKYTLAERKQKRAAFEKKYHKILARLEKLHAAAMKAKASR